MLCCKDHNQPSQRPRRGERASDIQERIEIRNINVMLHRAQKQRRYRSTRTWRTRVSSLGATSFIARPSLHDSLPAPGRCRAPTGARSLAQRSPDQDRTFQRPGAVPPRTLLKLPCQTSFTCRPTSSILSQSLRYRCRWLGMLADAPAHAATPVLRTCSGRKGPRETQDLPSVLMSEI